jgi:AbrB family looped-hinge helix DNA binding protein
MKNSGGKKKLGISTLTSNGQVMLPKKVRKHLGIDAGDSE